MQARWWSNCSDEVHFACAAPAKWKYRAIYRVGDAQVGLWSNTVLPQLPPSHHFEADHALVN